MFTNDKPANVVTAKIPCSCATELFVQWNIDTWVLRMPTVVCPMCGTSYTLKVTQQAEPQCGPATEITSTEDFDKMAVEMAKAHRRRGAR